MTRISNSIGLARIVLICGLVALHYGIYPGTKALPFSGIDLNDHPLATWFNGFMVFFFHAAVPVLSMISGWLFFTFLPQDAWPSIKRRMGNRVKTVLLPMCAWNLLYLGLLYTAFRLDPGSSAFSHTTRFGINFHDATLMNYLNAVLAINGDPVGFQFWFVRDLFVTVLLTPIGWVLLSRAPWIGAAGMFLLWITGCTLGGLFLRLDVPFFFYMGALFHQKHLRVDLSLRATILAVSFFATLAALRAIVSIWVEFPNDYAPYWLETATRSMRLFGVIGCWGVIYRLADTKPGIALSKYGGVAFFLYSAHWPLEALLKEALKPVIRGNGDGWLLLHYFLSVSLTIAICLCAAIALSKISPGLFSLMNGGRALGQNKNQRPAASSPAPVPGQAATA